MASDDGLVELIKLGPFLGIDKSTNELNMKPGFALSASNVNTSIIKGALLPERGRTLLFNATLISYFNGTIAEINILYPVVGPNQAPGVLFQGETVGGLLCTGYYDYNTDTITDLSGNLLGTETIPYAAFPFTQAVQFLDTVYTNGGQRFFPGWTPEGGLGPATQMYQWQYQPPVVLWDQPTPPVGLSPPNGVNINWTYAIATIGFGSGGKIQQGDILFVTITTASGTYPISYGVGTGHLGPDNSFTELAANLAYQLNLFFISGSGAGAADKVTASVFTNFDTANVPGTIAAQNPVGVLLSSNASGLIGNGYSVTLAMNAGGTEDFQVIPPTPPATPTSTVTTAFFYGANVNVGNMLGGYYFYLFTRITTMPNGTTSETSVLLDAQAASSNPYQTLDTPQYQTYPPKYLNNFFPAAYDEPLQVTIGDATYGSNSAVTFLGGPGNYVWAGTNPDGTTFTTNIYRASSLQENFIYQLVGNVSVQPAFVPPGANTGTYTISGTPTTGGDNQYVINGNNIVAPQHTGNTDIQQALADAAYLNSVAPALGNIYAASVSGADVVIANLTGSAMTTTGSSTSGDVLTPNQATIAGSVITPDNVAFTDTFSDLDISGNAVLTVHRDPPPFVAPSIFTGGGGEGPQTQSFNFGFMGTHQNRVWALVEVMVPVTSISDGASYIYLIPQIQLWFSNIGRAWEFDITNQVILLNADVVSYLQSNQVIPGTPYYGPNYDANYGNMPKALCEVGTTLMASMKREEWVIWGDGTASNPYVAKQAFNYGSLAGSTGTLAVRGGKYFVTESGDIYWYDGSSPQFKSMDVNSAVKLNSIETGLTVADLQSSCLAYSQDTLYWCFPTKGYSYSYDTNSNAWMSQLPYAPTSRYAVASSLWNPATLGAVMPNEVLATRTGFPTMVDQWFSDANGDAGVNYQVYTWELPHTACGKPDWRKWFKLARLFAPKALGAATLSIAMDNGDEISETFSVSFNLADPQKKQTKVFKGDTSKAIGYYAQVTLTVQSAPGQPAPIIWGVGIYGNLSDHLLVSSDA